MRISIVDHFVYSQRFLRESNPTRYFFDAAYDEYALHVSPGLRTRVDIKFHCLMRVRYSNV